MRRALAILTSCTLLGLAAAARSAPSVVDRPQSVCTYLARAANAGSLASSFVPTHPADDAAVPVPEEVAPWAEDAVKTRADINNDGKAEYVYFVEYPPRPPDDPSTLIQEMRIFGAFDIPQTVPRQALFIFDQALQRIEPERVEDQAKALAEDADRYRLLRYESRYYLVALAGDELRYALKFAPSNAAHPVCAFEQYTSGEITRTRALTTYQWLDRSFQRSEDYPGDLWLYAFGRADLAVAELLVANGHSVNERIRDRTLLVFAIKEELPEVIDWLLQHGADVSVDHRGDDTPLSLAIGDENVPLAVRLLKLGADPQPFIEDIVRIGKAGSGERQSLMLAAIDVLGYVPEEFVNAALDSEPSLLASLVACRVPVRPLGTSWHAGEPMKLPFHVDRSIHGSASGSAQTIERLFERGTIAAGSRYSVASYGSYERGVQVVRFDRSGVADDDFRLLATALCYYFIPFDCGSDELVTRARAWADAQRDDCPATARSVLSGQACRVIGYYSRQSSSVGAYHISADGSSKGDLLVEWQELLDTYRAKHAQ